MNLEKLVSTRKKFPVNLTLDTELLKKIDDYRKKHNLSWSKLIEAMAKVCIINDTAIQNKSRSKQKLESKK